MLTVHHLNFSRSTRVLWLLEELGLPYDVVRYERTPAFRAPPALAAVHPLGKAPVIQDGDLVLGESAVILTYVDARYGGGRFAPKPDTDAHYRHEEWLHYAESTAALPIMAMRVGAMSGGLAEGTRTFFAGVLTRVLDQIGRGLSGHAFLTGDDLALADIQMSYLVEVADRTGLLGGHPAIVDYLARLKARPAFARAEAAGGPMMPPA